MRDVRGHEDQASCLNGMRRAANDDFRVPVDDLHKRIERGGVFAESLAFVECEERHRSGVVFYDGTADNGAFAILCKVDERIGF